MTVLVSACLLGLNCKYSGGNNRDPAVIAFCEGREVIPVCPETAGGLPVPRVPAEMLNGEIRSRDGRDLTEAFREGARLCLEKCRGRAVTCAVLKARSPSCGVGRIYDGTFTGTLIPGDGVFAALLKARGIPVFTEAELEEAASCVG